jgi:hypothetical protein
MELGWVRKQVVQALVGIREREQQRRAAVQDAEAHFTTFLDGVATPLAQQVATALKAEGYTFTVFTPGRGLRLALDKGRDDFLELLLDTEGERPQVTGRVSYTRGSRTIVVESPVKEGVGPESLTEQDVFAYLMRALEPFLVR